MTQITLDIETIPSQLPGALDLIRASIKPPATFKKSESIAAWYETEAGAATAEVYRKQSLDGGLNGEIISIALVANQADDTGWSHCRKQGESEADLLERFSMAVVERTNAFDHGLVDPFFICHNAAFDLPYIWRRCIVKGVRLPFRFPRPSAREGKDYGCTMVQWAGYGGRVSLDALCRALSVPTPKDGGIDGSQVYDAWLNEEYERIKLYNLRDTIATAAIWHYLQGGAS